MLESRIGEELRATGLADVADLPNESLSRPQIQRLSIAQALLTRPALLLLDEPILGTDSPGDQGLLDLLASLRERGQTILMVTQRLEHAEFLCDTIGVLAQGRLAAEAEARSLRGPGRNVLITVLQLPAAVAERLRSLSPAVACEGNEIALQPNAPDLQARVLSELISADVIILALEPFGRPIEELYHRAIRGLPTSGGAAGQLPDPASAQAPPAIPGRPGTGDTLLRELLKNKDQQ
jgi:ABC-2 type transport system ATP-binding protein